jgi:hypothetical protein
MTTSHVPSTVPVEDDPRNPIVQWNNSKSSNDIDHALYLQGLAVFLFHNVLGQQGSLELTIEA